MPRSEARFDHAAATFRGRHNYSGIVEVELKAMKSSGCMAWTLWALRSPSEKSRRLNVTMASAREWIAAARMVVVLVGQVQSGD